MMQIEIEPTWTNYEVEEIIIDCPYCEKRIAPPKDPSSEVLYCDHVLFLYLVLPVDDDGFYYLREDMERSFKSFTKMLESHENYDEDDDGPAHELFMEGLKAFVKKESFEQFGKYLPPFRQLSGLRVLDIIEAERYYPTRIVVGFSKFGTF